MVGGYIVGALLTMDREKKRGEKVPSGGSGKFGKKATPGTGPHCGKKNTTSLRNQC